MGINNICTIVGNSIKPILMNGRHIKSINGIFNSKISSCQKKHNGVLVSNRINMLRIKRDNKINSEFNTITTFICELVRDRDISNVVIGYNVNWKQNTKLGKKNNRCFNQIPYIKLLSQLKHKLYNVGVILKIQEESYTSKCSFMDNEECCKQDDYKGRRYKRGLFITNEGVKINADVNAALNIFKKSVKDLETIVQDELLSIPLNMGLVMNPLKITLKSCTSKDEIKSILSKISN